MFDPISLCLLGTIALPAFRDALDVGTRLVNLRKAWHEKQSAKIDRVRRLHLLEDRASTSTSEILNKTLKVSDGATKDCPSAVTGCERTVAPLRPDERESTCSSTGDRSATGLRRRTIPFTEDGYPYLQSDTRAHSEGVFKTSMMATSYRGSWLRLFFHIVGIISTMHCFFLHMPIVSICSAVVACFFGAKKTNRAYHRKFYEKKYIKCNRSGEFSFCRRGRPRHIFLNTSSEVAICLVGLYTVVDYAFKYLGVSMFAFSICAVPVVVFALIQRVENIDISRGGEVYYHLDNQSSRLSYYVYLCCAIVGAFRIFRECLKHAAFNGIPQAHAFAVLQGMEIGLTVVFLHTMLIRYASLCVSDYWLVGQQLVGVLLALMLPVNEDGSFGFAVVLRIISSSRVLIEVARRHHTGPGSLGEGSPNWLFETCLMMIFVGMGALRTIDLIAHLAVKTFA